ncbi:two-component system, cell cycle response regulator [Faunimonas pinastri]|uniref:Two-component system, cell cycle response regulator n=1 Tax=Faunimonas pinastri TaxID=1855383 RepID=A0A1H9JAQ6_9HYPH|nr:PilZ domain-containing protein [Faunimonas pinastri]SEQ83867.1 two-component system, cell cycle response regulator [Faunimonas pinastri]
MEADEQRRLPRRRVLKQGRIVLEERGTIDCVIRDVNEKGARIRFNGPIALPDTFIFLNISDQTQIPARRAWQRSLDAGIQFTGEAGPIPPHFR